MKYYQTTESGSYLHDGLFIPNDPANRHYIQMMKEVSALEAEILAFVPAPKSVEQRRLEAYLAAGITSDKLAVAVYEKVIEGRTDAETGLDVMQAIRAQIKLDIPKV